MFLLRWAIFIGLIPLPLWGIVGYPDDILIWVMGPLAETITPMMEQQGGNHGQHGHKLRGTQPWRNSGHVS